jgi:hypothetical protein
MAISVTATSLAPLLGDADPCGARGYDPGSGLRQRRVRRPIRGSGRRACVGTSSDSRENVFIFNASLINHPWVSLRFSCCGHDQKKTIQVADLVRSPIGSQLPLDGGRGLHRPPAELNRGTGDSDGRGAYPRLWSGTARDGDALRPTLYRSAMTRRRTGEDSPVREGRDGVFGRLPGAQERIVMSSYQMGPLTVAHPTYRADIEIVEFPARVCGADIELVTFWMHVDRNRLVDRVAAVEFPTNTTANIELKDRGVVEVAYVPVDEAERRGHHVVIRTSGSARHDLGVQKVHEAWRYTSMIEYALFRYAMWLAADCRGEFQAEFMAEITALLVGLAERGELSLYSANRIKQGEYKVRVWIYDGLGRCSVEVTNTRGSSQYALGRDDDLTIVRAVTEFVQAEGIPDVTVSALGFRDPYSRTR